jgi:hypothetical protein
MSSNQDATRPIARTSTRSRFRWLAGSAVIALVASTLGGCFIETGRYHRPHHRVVYYR